MFIFVYATLLLSYIVTTIHSTTYSVIHPGHNIKVADCLSRLPLQTQPEEYSHDMTDDECIVQIQAATRGVISQSELTTATREDPNIQMEMKYMTAKLPPRKKLPGHLLTLYDVANELSIKYGMLHRGDRIVIPGEVQSRVIQLNWPTKETSA